MNYCQKEEFLSKQVHRDLGHCYQYFLWCSGEYVFHRGGQFFFRRPIFWARKFICAPDQARKKMGTQNQIARPIETQIKRILFAFYYLNSIYNHHF